MNISNLNYTVNINTNISAPIAEGDVIGKITYNIDGISYSSDLIAEHSVEKFNYYLLAVQIAVAIVVLLIVVKLIFFRKKKKKNNNYYKNYDSIYRFK